MAWCHSIDHPTMWTVIFESCHFKFFSTLYTSNLKRHRNHLFGESHKPHFVYYFSSIGKGTVTSIMHHTIILLSRYFLLIFHHFLSDFASLESPDPFVQVQLKYTSLPLLFR